MRYAAVAVALMVAFLASFVAVESTGVALLHDPAPWMGGTALAAAGVGVVLLVADVVLPVPSSLVMVTHGALFGVAAGTLLSTVGSVGAAAAAFAIGRGGGPLLDRLVGEEERRRADRLLVRWGVLAVALSRPVPLVAETVGILAGASPMSWSRLVVASAAGSLPAALLYALTGALARSFHDGAVLFLLVVTSSTGAWLALRRWERARGEPV